MTNRTAYLVTRDFGTWRGLARFYLGELEFLCGRTGCFLNLRPSQVRRVVFVCLGNINRSAFAQGVAATLGAQCASFGIVSTTGLPAYPLAVKTAQLFGIDLSTHRTTDMTAYTRKTGDLLVTMEIRHARQLVRAGFAPSEITLLGHWSAPHRVHIHDPHTLSDEYFKTCFTIIHSGVINLVDFLRRGESECVRR